MITIICYLPPLSPDLNPIEEAFAKVKNNLRQNNVVLQSVAGATPLFWEAFAQVTPPTIKNICILPRLPLTC